MFKHHKYCVIEATGVLTATEDDRGTLQLYLHDYPSSPTESNASHRTEGQAIRISDQGLVDFVKRHASPGGNPDCRYRLQARITGNVNMDGGETYLTDVTAAVLVDGNRTLTYAQAS